MIRHWMVRVGTSGLCTLVLTACTGDGADPRPPAPVVTTHEFEQRLTEHLSRFVTGVLEADAHAGTPTRSRTVGCADAPGGGPAWGVVPRAEMTISAGRLAEKYFEDLETWVRRNGFDRTDSWMNNKQPNEVWRVNALSKDGARLVVELPPKSPQFTVALTGPCTWPPDRPGGPPPSGQLPPLPAPAEPIQVSEHSTDEDVCRSPKIYVYNRAAPPFAGPGPHAMTLINYRDEESVGYVNLPSGWEPRDSNQRLVQTAVQLVVCVRVEVIRDSGRDVTCRYSFSGIPEDSGSPYTFDVYESIYHVGVREARSSKKISEFSLPGRKGDQESCPGAIRDHKRTLARAVDEVALERKLRPLYSSPR